MGAHCRTTKPFVALLLVHVFWLHASSDAWSQTAHDSRWQTLETKFTFIQYQTSEDLEKFSTKVKYGPGDWGVKRLFSHSGADTLPQKVTEKVDILFERVQEILGMRKKMSKVNIRLHANKDQLDEAFQGIYHQKNRLRAWYRFADNTVYMNVGDLHEGMLAHELAHSIVDHYLSVRPPGATAEILARYVDSHLK
jgi:hypothetical protein